MKKVLCIIALIVLIASYATFSMAAELSISLSPNKQKVEQGAEVKVSITLNGFTRQGNQKAVEAKVVYDKEKLEYKNISWNNGWTGSISADGTGLAANKSEQVSDSETIAEITYSVKENAAEGTSVISVQDVLTSSDGDEVTVSNSQTSIEIVKSGLENGNPGSEDEENQNGGETNNGGTNNGGTNNGETNNGETNNGGTNNGGKNNQNGKDGTLSEKKYPYTGVKDFILPIGALTVFAIFSYFGLKKYKDI